jgi:hypothetical protein
MVEFCDVKRRRELCQTNDFPYQHFSAVARAVRVVGRGRFEMSQSQARPSKGWFPCAVWRRNDPSHLDIFSMPTAPDWTARGTTTTFPG